MSKGVRAEKAGKKATAMSGAPPKSRAENPQRALGHRLAKLFFGALLFFAVCTVTPAALYKFVNPPSTPLMWIRWAESGYDKEYPLFIRRWSRLRDISPHLARAVLASEDQNFFQHSGFDLDAIESAIKHNANAERKQGASTISMQTARNVFLWQERTWLRKGLEAYFTVLIELLWGKQRILEVYLNVIEWGPGMFGCENAAMAYFHRPAKTVSPLESALLAAVLPNPRSWSVKRPSSYVIERQEKILKQMHHMRLPPLKKA